VRGLIGIFAAFAVFGMVAGCSRSTIAPVVQPTAALLFDAQPSMVTAHDIRYDRDWPNSKSLYRDPEHLSYQVFINDVQGALPWGRDYTFRRFRLYQEGTATR